MPELPEVETVVRTLNRLIKGYTIKKCTIFWKNLVKDIDVDEFEKQLIDQKILEITRIAKNIIFNFDKLVMISHLRMEGKWFIYKKNDVFDKKHVLAIFEFDNEYMACYNDTRRFGTFHLQNKASYKELNPIAKLGPEPFEDEMTPTYLSEQLKNSRTAIKTKLLDQTIIAGIGNIYADEVCFEAKIDPRTPSNHLTLNQLQDIIKASIRILKRSIELGGTTIDTYQAEHGVDGKFQNELMVHTRKGKKCKICSTIIIKTKVNGRGTYICERCQDFF